MKKALLNVIFVAVISLILTNCANRGTPNGGEKDVEPPKIIKSSPENYSVNFSGNEIVIKFNEYVKLKNIQKQLIISPPMNTAPQITPVSGASKELKIKILDTLKPNTTYAFNFGSSIVDNNEDNPFTYYRYVLSTGSYIDSLSVSGTVIDAINRKPDDFISVMLYEVDSSFSDSIVYKDLPRYITNTLDSVNIFKIENIKAGKYMLVAMKDENEDNKFQQKIDKIGFLNDYITVPKDSSIQNIKLFKEETDFKAFKPQLISGEKLAFGYEGNAETMKIELLSEAPENYESTSFKDATKDSLNYFYKPKLEVDSLIFKVSNTNYEKEFTARIKDNERDSLVITTSHSNNINFKEDYTISANIPLANIDESKISILDKDSVKVNFTTEFDALKNGYQLNFEKTESNQYRIQALPEAFTDFFDNKNDTLSYNLRTKSKSDYANIRLRLVNAKYPVIVQLTDDKDDVKYELYSTKNEPIDFFNVTPAMYYLRVVYDTNENKKYDTGNYLKKIQPERVSHFGKVDDDALRSNFDYQIVFTLLD